MDDVDGVFDEARDVRDGGLLERDQIRLLTPFGPYDQDFDDDDDVATEEGSATCPDCGSEHVHPSGGCPFCPECGWSKCGGGRA